MRFGICAPLSDLEILSAAGYEYWEPAVTTLLQPESPEAEIMPPLLELCASSQTKPETFNLFLPGDLKVVGPKADLLRQRRYLNAAFRRVKMLGGEIVVFGSGGARHIPEGWSHAEAHTQIREFLTLCGGVAEQHGVCVAIEPLNTLECNLINSVAEAAALVQEIGHSSIGVLSDLYHIAQDGQSYDETRDAGSWLRHVHVAGLGRRGPISADYEFLRSYFAVLKECGYKGRISIEANWDDLQEQAPEALWALRSAWKDA